MRMQDSQAGCGPATLSNALAAVGIRRSVPECEVLCGTTATAGTPIGKMIKALRALDVAGIDGLPLKERRRDVAVLKLEKALRAQRPVLMVVDNGGHWVAAVGMIGNRILVADPADNELVLSYEPEELLTRWDTGGTYYGVIV